MVVILGMLVLVGGIGCASASPSSDSVSPGSPQTRSPGTPEGSHYLAGFSGLPVVRLSFVCGESGNICVFRDGDFTNNFNSNTRERSEIEVTPEVPLVPQAEYIIECNLRDSEDDWEQSTLGATVQECSFEVTLAAYPEDSEEVRAAGHQIEPVSPPSGVDPNGDILPPAAFPPGPSRTHAVQTIEAMPRRPDYRAACTVRPPVSSETGYYLVPAVRNCSSVGSRPEMTFPDSP